MDGRLSRGLAPAQAAALDLHRTDHSVRRDRLDSAAPRRQHDGADAGRRNPRGFQGLRIALAIARQEQLASTSLILSHMKDVRSAFSTGDPATIRDTAGELWQKISRQDAIFIVADPRGQVIATLGNLRRLAIGANSASCAMPVPGSRRSPPDS